MPHVRDIYTYKAEVLRVFPDHKVSLDIDLGFKTWKVIILSISNLDDFDIKMGDCLLISFKSVRSGRYTHVYTGTIHEILLQRAPLLGTRKKRAG